MTRIIDHIDLRVKSMEQAAPFYRAFLPLLGFTARLDIPGWLQFEAPGKEATAFFGLAEDPQHVANRTRIAFWAASKRRVDELATALPGLGARNIEGPGWEGSIHYAVFFEDPSGNALEICFRPMSFRQAEDNRSSDASAPLQK